MWLINKVKFFYQDIQFLALIKYHNRLSDFRVKLYPDALDSNIFVGRDSYIFDIFPAQDRFIAMLDVDDWCSSELYRDEYLNVFRAFYTKERYYSDGRFNFNKLTDIAERKLEQYNDYVYFYDLKREDYLLFTASFFSKFLLFLESLTQRPLYFRLSFYFFAGLIYSFVIFPLRYGLTLYIYLHELILYILTMPFVFFYPSRGSYFNMNGYDHNFIVEEFIATDLEGGYGFQELVIKPFILGYLKPLYHYTAPFFSVLRSYFRINSFLFYFFYAFIYPPIFFFYFLDYLIFFIVKESFFLLSSVFYWSYYILWFNIIFAGRTIFKVCYLIFFYITHYILRLVGLVSFVFVLLFSVPFFEPQLDWTSWLYFKFLNWFSSFEFSFAFLDMSIFFSPVLNNTNQSGVLNFFIVDFVVFTSVFGFLVLLLSFWFFPFYPKFSAYSDWFLFSSFQKSGKTGASGLDDVMYDEDAHRWSEDGYYTEDADGFDEDEMEVPETEDTFMLGPEPENEKEEGDPEYVEPLGNHVYPEDDAPFDIPSALRPRLFLTDFMFQDLGFDDSSFVWRFDAANRYYTTQEGWSYFSIDPNQFYNSPLRNFDTLLLNINFLYSFSSDYGDSLKLFNPDAVTFYNQEQWSIMIKLVEEFEFSLIEYYLAGKLFNPKYLDSKRLLALAPFAADYTNLRNDPIARYLESFVFSDFYKNSSVLLEKSDFTKLVNDPQLNLPVEELDYNPRFYFDNFTAYEGDTEHQEFEIYEPIDDDTFDEDDFISEDFFSYDEMLDDFNADWDYREELITHWAFMFTMIYFQASVIDEQTNLPDRIYHFSGQVSTVDDEQIFNFEWLAEEYDDMRVYKKWLRRYPIDFHKIENSVNHFRLVSLFDFYNADSFFNYPLSTIGGNRWYKHFFDSEFDYSYYYLQLLPDIFDFKRRYHGRILPVYYEFLYKPFYTYFYRQNFIKDRELQRKFTYLKYLENYSNILPNDASVEKLIALMIFNFRGFNNTRNFDDYIDLPFRPYKYKAFINELYYDAEKIHNIVKEERVFQGRPINLRSFTWGIPFAWDRILRIRFWFTGRILFEPYRNSWGWGTVRNWVWGKGWRYQASPRLRTSANRRKRVVFSMKKKSVYGFSIFDSKVPSAWRMRRRRAGRAYTLWNPYYEDQPFRLFRTRSLPGRAHRGRRYRSRFRSRKDSWIFQRRIMRILPDRRKRKDIAPIPYILRIRAPILKFWFVKRRVGRDHRRLAKRVLTNYFSMHIRGVYATLSAYELRSIHKYYARYHRMPGELKVPHYSQVVRYSTQPQFSLISFYSRNGVSIYTNKSFDFQTLAKDLFLTKLHFEQVLSGNISFLQYVSNLFYLNFNLLWLRLLFFQTNFFNFLESFNSFSGGMFIFFGGIFSRISLDFQLFPFLEDIMTTWGEYIFDNLGDFFSISYPSIYFSIYIDSESVRTQHLGKNSYLVDYDVEVWSRIVSSPFEDFYLFDKLFLTFDFINTIVCDTELNFLDPLLTAGLVFLVFITILFSTIFYNIFFPEVWHNSFQEVKFSFNFYYSFFYRFFTFSYFQNFFKYFFSTFKSPALAFYTSNVFLSDPFILKKLEHFSLPYLKNSLLFARFNANEAFSFQDFININSYVDNSDDMLVEFLTYHDFFLRGEVDPEDMLTGEPMVWSFDFEGSLDKLLIPRPVPLADPFFVFDKYNKHRFYYYDDFFYNFKPVFVEEEVASELEKGDVEEEEDGFSSHFNFFFGIFQRHEKGVFIDGIDFLAKQKASQYLNADLRFSNFTQIDFWTVLPLIDFYGPLISSSFLTFNTNITSFIDVTQFIGDYFVQSDEFDEVLDETNEFFLPNLYIIPKKEMLSLYPEYLQEAEELINAPDSFEFGFQSINVNYFGDIVDFSITDTFRIHDFLEWQESYNLVDSNQFNTLSFPWSNRLFFKGYSDFETQVTWQSRFLSKSFETLLFDHYYELFDFSLLRLITTRPLFQYSLEVPYNLDIALFLRSEEDYGGDYENFLTSKKTHEKEYSYLKFYNSEMPVEYSFSSFLENDLMFLKRLGLLTPIELDLFLQSSFHTPSTTEELEHLDEIDRILKERSQYDDVYFITKDGPTEFKEFVNFEERFKAKLQLRNAKRKEEILKTIKTTSNKFSDPDEFLLASLSDPDAIFDPSFLFSKQKRSFKPAARVSDEYLSGLMFKKN
jgi:hypothetical protein